MDLTKAIMQSHENLKLLKKTIRNDEQAHNIQEEANIATGEWRRIGNQHFAFKRYQDSVYAYTKSIVGGDTSIDLLANRAAAYIALTKFKFALLDVEQALAIDKNHIKCVYRKVKALFGLKLYDEAVAYIETITLESIPSKDRHIITDAVVKAKSFIAQSKHGEYPWDDLYTSTSIYQDMADFTGSVVLKESPMKGRGLFATKSIKAGELILASKAFAYLQDKIEIPDEILNSISSHWSPTDLLSAQINIQLEQKVLQVLKENPSKCQQLYTLYAGPKFGYLPPYEEGAITKDLQIDFERVEEICRYNRISNCDDSAEDGSMKRNAGIWIYPSFLNHDCVDANSSWQNLGDLLFVRAYRNISEGEEILITYQAPNGLIAQEALNMYGFNCTCRLCLRDRQDNKNIQAKRAKLFSQLQTILGKFKNPTKLRMDKKHEKEISRIFKVFQQTREDVPELNFCLVDDLLIFGMLRMEISQFIEAAHIFENLYNMIKTIPAYFSTAIEACIHVVLAYATVDKSKANFWIGMTKKTAKLVYGTEKVLYVKYATYIQMIRDKGLDV